MSVEGCFIGEICTTIIAFIISWIVTSAAAATTAATTAATASHDTISAAAIVAITSRMKCVVSHNKIHSFHDLFSDFIFQFIL
jgi:hypothetical protein